MITHTRIALIDCLMRLKGISKTKLANKLGISHVSVIRCLKSDRSERVERAVADELGLPVWQVFNDFYDTNGKRLNHARMREINARVDVSFLLSAITKACS